MTTDERVQFDLEQQTSAAEHATNGREGSSLGVLRRIALRTSKRFARVQAMRFEAATAPATADSNWFWQQCSMELERARRHDRSFTILCLRLLDPDSGGDEIGASVASSVRSLLRLPDLVLAEHDQILIVLSETSGLESVECVLERICALIDDEPDRMSWRTITFPDDGLTFRSLVEWVYSDGDGSLPLLAG